ncbi:hypothetical protein OG596_00525 [Streptomyces sp. NBC_01102]|uniref:hypothetical protein n=1 Tax=Streptomyces sp. NBC_01102 TaxID=2903749 RepID=UPI00386660FA|nr:hypothetical protein OG596_00525 [Streptomyces sp. NBC_01102]
MQVRDAARRLPDIPVLRDRCRAPTTVEAILEPDFPYHRHGFDAHRSGTQELAWTDNEGGDQYSVGLSADGMHIRGFDQTSPMNFGVTLNGFRDGIAAAGYPQHASRTTADSLRSHER